MKVQADLHKVRRHAIAILLETAYVLIIAGLSLLVAIVAELALR